MPYGQQEFGTLAPANGCPYSWWDLSVTAGDHLTVDWESQATGLPYAALYPKGTNDYDYPQTQYVADSFLNGNQKGQLTYTVPSTGVMPLAFTADDLCNADDQGGGPYDFTAYVVHAVTLSLKGVAPHARSGRATVGVHSPDGTPLSDPAIKVQLRASTSGRKTVKLGVSTPSHGLAAVRYKLPASWTRKKVTVRASAEGPGYLTATSTAEGVRF